MRPGPGRIAFFTIEQFFWPRSSRRSPSAASRLAAANEVRRRDDRGQRARIRAAEVTMLAALAA
jgi:hypothetical protein